MTGNFVSFCFDVDDDLDDVLDTTDVEFDFFLRSDVEPDFLDPETDFLDPDELVLEFLSWLAVPAS